jgi:UDP-3-O-[3-hydroxymyristoyl] N-acetylglucosamine deacetylase
MDGLPETLKPIAMVSCQRTLKSAISCVGVGLHSGQRVNLTLRPAEPGAGIVFRRTDLAVDIPARHDRVVDTRLSTVLASAADPAARVGTVEHLMAALFAAGVDNVIVDVDGPEVPVLDGSSAPYLFLIDCAGVLEQAAPRQVIEVLRPVRVEAGEAFAELRPAAYGLGMSVSIDFAAEAIGRQALTLQLTDSAFRHELAAARTFTQRAEIEAMQEAGLARGGSLDNAIVVDGAQVLNPEGLRRPDEFVRHKMLDAVGDLALAGSALQARFVAHRTGHALNNALLRALFADSTAWRFASMEPVSRSFYPFAARAAA